MNNRINPAKKGPHCQRSCDDRHFQRNFLGVYPNRQYFIRAKPGFDILYADGRSPAVWSRVSSDDR